MKVKLFTILFSFVFITGAYAETRFVSKTGTNKPPYTSWATAADSIQKAINICKPGDTVYVGNGVYKEKVILSKGISFFGSGIDSCIIDTRTIYTPTGFYAIQSADSCHIKNFNIIVANNQTGVGIELITVNNYTIAEFNKISDAYNAFDNNDADFIFRNNIVNNCWKAIHSLAFLILSKPLIENNVINVSDIGTAIQISVGNEPTIRNNIIKITGDQYNTGIRIFVDQKAYIYGNIVIGDQMRDAIIGRLQPSIIRNNLVVGKCSYSAITHGDYPVENNIIMNSDAGFLCDAGSGKMTKYNNVWNVKKPYLKETSDSTNISADPMFVNADSLDFHLQMFSQLIDAGNPDIKDVDGTRSDIGPLGGPYGESYAYKDLPPKTPVNLSVTANEKNDIEIKWNKNTEADFDYYKIYSDTVKGFIADSSKELAVVKVPFFIDKFNSTKKYYKIRAVDKQGNESRLSEEVGIEITGVNETKFIVDNYRLYNNYPNPFNPSTKIGYRLKEPCRVKLAVYDIKGELIVYLVNNQQDAGYHEVEFTSKNKQTGSLSSGIYICRLDVINSYNINVFTDAIKMLLLK